MSESHGIAAISPNGPQSVLAACFLALAAVSTAVSAGAPEAANLSDAEIDAAVASVLAPWYLVIQEMAGRQQTQVFAFSACVIGTAGKYSDSRTSNEEAADLTIAGCVEPLYLYHKASLRLFEAKWMLTNTLPDPSGQASLFAKAQADDATRKMMVEGRRQAVEMVIKTRLAIAGAKTPLPPGRKFQ